DPRLGCHDWYSARGRWARAPWVQVCRVGCADYPAFAQCAGATTATTWRLDRGDGTSGHRGKGWTVGVGVLGLGARGDSATAGTARLAPRTARWLDCRYRTANTHLETRRVGLGAHLVGCATDS